MKRFLAIWLGSFPLILAAAFCTLGTIISAFGFSVNLRTLFYVLLAGSLVLSALVTHRRGKGLLLCLAPILMSLYVAFPEFSRGGRWVVFFISQALSEWFPVPILFPAAKAATSEELLIFFVAVGVFLAVLLSIAVCLRRSTALTLALTLPIIILSILILDYPPSPWFPIGLFAVYLTMLVSRAAYPNNFIKRDVFVLPSLVLSVLFLGAVYKASGPEQHVRGALVSSLDSKLRNLVAAEQIAFSPLLDRWPNSTLNFWRFDKQNVPVADADRRIVTQQTLLEVTVNQAGTYYLYGYSMQLFDGRAWKPGSASRANTITPAAVIEQYNQLNPEDAPSLITMTVTKINDFTGIDYIPYYSTATGNQTPGEFTFFYPQQSILSIAAAIPPDTPLSSSVSYVSRTNELFTDIDDDTAAALREIANRESIDINSDRATIAVQVADYVSNAARYTLAAPKIPTDEDFALYFLETAKAGYCVHFATAATLMLRALDVPARFVSGFTVTVSERNVGQSVAVMDKDAHAWVEVYYDNIGWVPLEVTASSAGFGGIEASPPHNVDGGERTISALAPVTPTPPSTTSPDQSQQTTPPTADATQTPTAPPTQSTPPPAVNMDTNSSTVFQITFFVILGLAAVAAVLALRRSLVTRHRAKAFAQSDTNAAVIYARRYISTLMPQDDPALARIDELALKARFSQHTLSEDERTEAVRYAISLAKKTYLQCNLASRLWLRYVRVAV